MATLARRQSFCRYATFPLKRELPFGLRPFPLSGEFPASGGGFKYLNRSGAILNYQFSIINYQLFKYCLMEYLFALFDYREALCEICGGELFVYVIDLFVVKSDTALLD